MNRQPSCRWITVTERHLQPSWLIYVRTIVSWSYSALVSVLRNKRTAETLASIPGNFSITPSWESQWWQSATCTIKGPKEDLMCNNCCVWSVCTETKEGHPSTASERWRQRPPHVRTNKLRLSGLNFLFDTTVKKRLDFKLYIYVSRVGRSSRKQNTQRNSGEGNQGWEVTASWPPFEQNRKLRGNLKFSPRLKWLKQTANLKKP